MARQKKNGTYLNVCIDSEIYEKLRLFCDNSGQTKTFAVERALLEYFEEYTRKQRMLEKLEQGNI